ncbi:hypothetical protein Acr_03g0003070 [Actinidia rufa]|uniref:Uncharacterized protein n=1 Tax=Actinidia rufa TaxID=165716 RepID=A0A7J0EAQ3_9ERIC|nr:hypothetical protein Acr_03g0003070 [Actinidia rufa]
MTGAAASGSGLSKFLRPGLRPQATDIQAAAMWGVAAATTALWIVQLLFLEKNIKYMDL